jgi:F-type H+-transporting ATPase subunit epsilon
MAENNQNLEVVTPEGVAFSGEAEMVVVQGAAGQLGVLANHAPLVSTLKPGRTRVTDAEGGEHLFATGEGFIQVRHNRTLVLVNEAVASDAIDAAAARERLEAARTALEQAKSSDDGDVEAAEREELFAAALVEVAGS